MTPLEAFLNTISGLEAGGQNLLYGGDLVQGSGRHPAISVPIRRDGKDTGKFSSAAGLFQITEPTWNDYAPRLGVTDFTPKSQLKVASAIATDRYRKLTGRSLEADLASGDPALVNQAARTLAPTWTSLPGGDESRVSDQGFLNSYNANLKGQSHLLTPEPLGPDQGGFRLENPILPMGFQPQASPLAESLAGGILPAPPTENRGSSIGGLSGSGIDSDSILPSSKGGTGGESDGRAYNLDTDPASYDPTALGGELPEFPVGSLANLFTLDTIGGAAPATKGPTGSSFYPPTGYYRG